MGQWLKIVLCALLAGLTFDPIPAMANPTASLVPNLDELATRYDEVLYIDNMGEFLTHVADENTALVIATTSTDDGGNYVFDACPDGVDERTDPGCGMVTLGAGTGVFGEGRNEIVAGLPTGDVLANGPLFDCGALAYDEPRQPTDWGPGDFNGWDLGCFEIFGGNTLSGIRIDNGPDAVAQDPGVGVHRNGVLVRPGDGKAVIEHSVLTDVRRAALVTAGSGDTTDFVAFGNIALRTELAGFFLIMAPAPPTATYGAAMAARLEANYLDEIGLISMVYAWGVGGSENHSDAKFINNVIGSNTTIGLSVFGEGFLTPEPITDHTAKATMKGGSIASQIFSMTMFSFDDGPRPDNDRNSVIVDLKDVTFSNSDTPVYVEYEPWGPDNDFRIKMRRNEYLGAAPGHVDVCAFSFDVFDCEDPGDDAPFQFKDKRHVVENTNTNFTFGEVADAFFK